MEHLRKEITELPTGTDKLREFAYIVGGILALVGAWFVRRHGISMAVGLIPGGMLMTLGVAAPATLRSLYLGWMTLAILMGEMVSKILLTLLYFGAILPIGIVSRLAGNDFLRSKWKSGEKSFWITRETAKEKPDYRRQF